MKQTLCLTGAALLAVAAGNARAGVVMPAHVVVVIEENHDKSQIIGTPNAPFINSMVSGGVYYANAHGTDHDSQPNYLELFSGANPGAPGINTPLQVKYPTNPTPAQLALENNSDNYSSKQPFSNPNLGAELLHKGLTFAGYSQGQPSAGFIGAQFPLAPASRLYVEKHNPWAQFQGTGTNQLPASTNQPFTAFPTDFAKLPTVSFVVPDEAHDMHDQVSLAGLRAVGNTNLDAKGNIVSDATTVRTADNWLSTNLGAYAQWAQSHNSLLVVTTDEDDFNIPGTNNIATVVSGDSRLVRHGVNNDYVNHFNLLRTIEDQFGLGHAGRSADVLPFATNDLGQLTGTSAVPLPNAAYMAFLTVPLVVLGYRRMRKTQQS